MKGSPFMEVVSHSIQILVLSLREKMNLQKISSYRDLKAS